MRRLSPLLLAATLAAAGLAVPAPAAAGPPPRPGAEEPPPTLTALLPPLPVGRHRPSAAPHCPRGEIACVDAVIARMRRRLDGLLASCDHDAAFALTYLRVTEAYRGTVAANPRFFDDSRFMNHLATVFADAWFRADAVWHRGATSPSEGVPAAWQVAFRAADGRRVSAAGNLLLGLSAHVNRDLPFVLATVGLRGPDGASRKPDHDRVNTILRDLTAPILAEIARRLDPEIATADVRGTRLDEDTLFQLLALWREEAWRNAELLAAAPTATGRAVVAQTIEASALLKQEALLTATTYRPPVSSPRSRDTWCRSHR